jgi:hypothetical protein
VAEDRYEPLPGLLEIPGFLLGKLSPRGRRIAAIAGALIALGVAALRAAGLPAPTIDLGHLGLAREVLSALALPEPELEEARRRIAPDFGVLETCPGGVLLRAWAEELEWMARVLIQIGCPFRVLHPPELREALRQKAREISRYSRRAAQPPSRHTRSPRRSTTSAASVPA